MEAVMTRQHILRNSKFLAWLTFSHVFYYFLFFFPGRSGTLFGASVRVSNFSEASVKRRFCQHTSYGLNPAGKTELLLVFEDSYERQTQYVRTTETILNRGRTELHSSFSISGHQQPCPRPFCAVYTQKPVALHRLQADGMQPGQRGQH